MPDKLMAYVEEVLDYLEYLGYPDYVQEYDPADVATSIFQVQKRCYKRKVSPRMCALGIFGLTWKYQIAPHLSKQTVH